MADTLPKRNKVFISYSHQDAEWLKRLRVHLKPLENDYHIDIWDDTRIRPGSKWKDEIEEALASAKVAVLLVSADFLASDFITTNELPPLLSAAESGGAIILPVILSPSRFLQNKFLYQFQSVNDPSKPLINLSKGEQEAVLVKVSVAIENALQLLEEGQGEKAQVAEAAVPGERKGRSMSLSKSQGIGAALIAAVATIIVGYWQFGRIDSQPKEVQYAGRVIDRSTQVAISGAKIIVEGQGPQQIYYTDSDGYFYLKLSASNDAVHIRVEANNYTSFDRTGSLTRTGTEDIRLTPVNSPTPTPSPSPIPSPTPRSVIVRPGHIRPPANTNRPSYGPDQTNAILHSRKPGSSIP